MAQLRRSYSPDVKEAAGSQVKSSSSQEPQEHWIAQVGITRHTVNGFAQVGSDLIDFN